MPNALSPADQALVELGLALKERDYRFVTVTPETHRRVNVRPENALARTVEDIFGWSRPFDTSPLFPIMERAGVVENHKSTVRFSSIGSELFVHSAYPTIASNSVFFGPDTYRFVAWLDAVTPEARRAVDIGCGSGAGGLIIADRCAEVVLADINELALRYAAVNTALVRRDNVVVCKSDVLNSVQGEIDLIVSNPPYIVDDDARLYRDGGASLGCGLSHRILVESLDRLALGGTLLLYTGTPVVKGRYVFLELAREALENKCRAWDLVELDPDVFGEELERPQYRSVDRIAVIGVSVVR
jgi:SAM-dependent methyltransferase